MTLETRSEAATLRLELEAADSPVAVPVPRSDNPDPKGRREEELSFGARPALEAVRKRCGAAAMMEALEPLAEYYGLERGELLDAWARHYGPTMLAEAGHERLAVHMVLGGLGAASERVGRVSEEMKGLADTAAETAASMDEVQPDTDGGER